MHFAKRKTSCCLFMYSSTVVSIMECATTAMVSFDYCLKVLNCTNGLSLFYMKLRVFTLAESLGAVESLAESPSLMTHASVPDDQRQLLGIDDTLIRLSVGIESCHDLIEDLDRALNEALTTMKQQQK